MLLGGAVAVAKSAAGRQAAWIVDFLLQTAQKVPTVAEGLGIWTAAAVLGRW